ncbi:MAG: hypothetical protein IH851_02235 [Armatimonadetes bacterium]|nr:hypothetical protein [Armatimonadota bacterium]
MLSPHNDGFIVGRADGGAKWMSARKFLSETPTEADYIVGSYGSGWQCGPTSGSRTIADPPQWFKEWPLWALH